MTGEGIGARLPRKEDDRYIRGQGQFVGDIRLPRMQDVTFLRSPVAHARIRSIGIPPAFRHCVFIADDLIGVRAIRADTALAGFKSSLQPVLPTPSARASTLRFPAMLVTTGIVWPSMFSNTTTGLLPRRSSS